MFIENEIYVDAVDFKIVQYLGQHPHPDLIIQVFYDLENNKYRFYNTNQTLISFGQ